MIGREMQVCEERMNTAKTLSSVSLAFTVRSVLFCSLCRAGHGLGGRCLVTASDLRVGQMLLVPGLVVQDYVSRSFLL